MSLYVPTDSWGWRLVSTAGVRPTARYGTVVTPGLSNAMGAWVECVPAASMIHDALFVHVQLSFGYVSAAARDILVDIGIDPAGGTNYSVLIPYLLGTGADDFHRGGVNYVFPLRIPAGASIAARAQVNNASSAGLIGVRLKLYGMPRRPEMWKYGHKVSAYGIVSASSRGTLVTPGQAADGAWTSLGNTTADHFFFDIGMGTNDATMTFLAYVADLAHGDATNKYTILDDVQFGVATAEQIAKPPIMVSGGFGRVPSGAELFTKLWCSAAPDTQVSIAAYGVS